MPDTVDVLHVVGGDMGTETGVRRKDRRSAAREREALGRRGGSESRRGLNVGLRRSGAECRA